MEADTPEVIDVKIHDEADLSFVPVTVEDIEDIFSYHSPTPEQIPHYTAFRAAAKTFALAILEHTPASPDQCAALRKLRECTMTANASIALGGKY